MSTSVSGFTPVNQVRLTNVAYVRLQKAGKRFEIACYRNKVLNWRNKIETDLKEVLQIDTVFTNVSKGMLASGKDLMEAFGSSDPSVVCKEILDKGDMQVSEKERGAWYESIYKDVATIVVDKSVNPENNRPYTVTMIQNAMKQIHYSVSKKSAKSQALDVIRKLKTVMSIARANMFLRIVCHPTEMTAVRTELAVLGIIVSDKDSFSPQQQQQQQQWVSCDFKIEPDLYRKVEELVQRVTDSTGRLEVLQLRSSVDNITTPAPSSSLSSSSSSAAAAESEAADTHPQQEQLTGSLLPHEDSHSNNEEHEDGDDDIDEDLDNRQPLGIVSSKNNRKNKKKLLKQSKLVVAQDSAPVDDDEEEEEEDDEEEEELKQAIVLSKSVATAESVKVVKHGKKNKRHEKEALKEMQIKVAAIKLRDAGLQDAILPTIHQASELGYDISPPPVVVTEGSPALQKCNTCGGGFADSNAYRNHFRTEWHRLNLNRKLKNLPIIPSQQAFDELNLLEFGL